MELKDITAAEIMQDDWFLLAGKLYRVGAVNIYANSTVGIQFYNPNQERPGKLTLGNISVASNLPMQILNQ